MAHSTENVAIGGGLGSSVTAFEDTVGLATSGLSTCGELANTQHSVLSGRASCRIGQ